MTEENDLFTPDTPAKESEDELHVAPELRQAIVYEQGCAHEAVQQALPPLGNSGSVYQRSNRLVNILGAKKNPEATIQRDEGSPVINQIAAGALWEILSKTICWMKWDGRSKKHVECAPPGAVVTALHTRGEWESVPYLRGISSVPILRPNGSIRIEPGYDAESSLFYAPTGSPPQVPGAPHREDAESAAHRILDVVSDFPFVASQHRSAWLSTLLALIARPAFDGGVPMTLIDANTPGTGKTLLADVAAYIATGMHAPRSPYVKEDDELRKRITAHLAAGDQVALIDNVPAGRAVGWPSLDNALTASIWADRELGKTSMIRVPMQTVWMVTGNNLRIGGDAARRTLKIRLEARSARPEERTGFKYSPLMEHLESARPFLLADAITVVRAYLQHGSPDQNLRPMGSFEGWSATVRSAMVWCGLDDPVDASVSHEVGMDDEGDAHVTILESWSLLEDAGEGLKLAQVIGQCNRRGEDLEDLIEALLVLSPTKDDSMPTATRLGYVFRGLSNRWKLTREGQKRLLCKTGHGKTKRWRVEEMEVIKPTNETKNAPLSGGDGGDRHTLSPRERELSVDSSQCLGKKVPSSPPSPPPEEEEWWSAPDNDENVSKMYEIHSKDPFGDEDIEPDF